jgi:pimeloyl-ACP methyl ester carboxylesterase
VDYIACGLYATVVCGEYLPNEDGVATLKTLTAQQTWGDGGQQADMAEACASWNVNPIPSSLRTAVQSKAKALLISGDLDIRTPPRLGAQAAKGLPGSTHLVIPYAGHADTAVTIPCVAQIITDYFNANGDMASVNTGCTKSLSPPVW